MQPNQLTPADADQLIALVHKTTGLTVHGPPDLANPLQWVTEIHTVVAGPAQRMESNANVSQFNHAHGLPLAHNHVPVIQ